MSSPTHIAGRTLARSQALQLLFQAEATGRAVEDVLAGDYALSEGPLDPFGELLARGADGMRHDLDLIIADVSANWSLSRMPSVDRNLLRIALYEMLEVDEVEIPVTINESVILAKAYGTDESSRFINGLLGKVSRELDEGLDPLEVAREHKYGHKGKDGAADADAAGGAQAEPEAAEPADGAAEAAADEAPADGQDVGVGATQAADDADGLDVPAAAAGDGDVPEAAAADASAPATETPEQA